ncbi:MAG: hypothetical protein ACFCUL_13340 [Flavobacteriaceae bacterium]
MPWYNDLRPIDDANKQHYALIFPGMTNTEKVRTIQNILKLRESLKTIPEKRTDKNLLVCSWNLKDFGAYRQRIPESYFYMAEIFSKFDLVSVQECRADLEPLNILLRILGSDWTYLYNDVSDHEGSNSERSLIVYDKRRCNFSGQAGEIILHHKISENHDLKQFNRIPYLTGFTAEWKKFSLITLHLQPGKNVSDVEIRKAEIKFLMKLLEKRLKRTSEVRLWSDNIIILGDMNLYKTDTEAFQILTDNHFVEVAELIGKDTTTAASDNVFDRIFFYKNSEYPALETTNKGGVFRMFDTVFTDEQANDPAYLIYIDALEQQRIEAGEGPYADKTNYYKTHWRTRQMSDHYPIWVEMEIDSSDEFLRKKLRDFES